MKIPFVKNGVIGYMDDVSIAFVESESDLEDLTPNVSVGCIAIQYGFAAMWQLAADGAWEEIE